MSLSKLALLFGVVAPFAFAQQDNASILGSVTDSSGAVVPNASVEIRNTGTDQTLKLLTDSNGNFFAPVVHVGIYRVSVSAAGPDRSVAGSTWRASGSSPERCERSIPGDLSPRARTDRSGRSTAPDQSQNSAAQGAHD